MADAAISIDYTITNIAHNAGGTSTVSYTLDHTDTSLTQSRTDRFKDSVLGAGIESDAETADKVIQLKVNFEAAALAYFKAFAALVRAAQDQDLTELLDSEENTVSGLSLGALPTMGGTVVVRA